VLKWTSRSKSFLKSPLPLPIHGHQEEETHSLYHVSWGVDGEEKEIFLASCLLAFSLSNILSISYQNLCCVNNTGKDKCHQPWTPTFV
jgi:hypothetical protein